MSATPQTPPANPPRRPRRPLVDIFECYACAARQTFDPDIPHQSGKGVGPHRRVKCLSCNAVVPCFLADGPSRPAAPALFEPNTSSTITLHRKSRRGGLRAGKSAPPPVGPAVQPHPPCAVSRTGGSLPITESDAESCASALERSLSGDDPKPTCTPAILSPPPLPVGELDGSVAFAQDSGSFSVGRRLPQQGRPR